MLFVWNDPEGNPPPPERRRSRGSRRVGSDEWSDWIWTRSLVEGSNCREIIDNVVDMAHFYYIHFAFPTYFKNVFEGHVATQYMDRAAARRRNRRELRRRGRPAASSEASYFGPSYMIDWLWTRLPRHRRSRAS